MQKFQKSELPQMVETPWCYSATPSVQKHRNWPFRNVYIVGMTNENGQLFRHWTRGHQWIQSREARATSIPNCINFNIRKPENVRVITVNKKYKDIIYCANKIKWLVQRQFEIQQTKQWLHRSLFLANGNTNEKYVVLDLNDYVATPIKDLLAKDWNLLSSINTFKNKTRQGNEKQILATCVVYTRT